MRRLMLGTLTGLVMLGAVVLTTGGSAGAVSGAWTDGPVTIRVELDLPDSTSSNGPRVLEVTGVTPGPQVELTSADETANPSGWCGTLAVDIDPLTQTVTVATGQGAEDGIVTPPVPPIDQLSSGYYWDYCDFEVASVEISGPEFATFTVVSDSLWDPSTCEEDSTMAMTLSSTSPDSTTIAWVNTSATGTESTCDLGVPDEGDFGVSVFSYSLPVLSTTTTTTVASTTTAPTTTAPTTTLPAAVDADAAQPVEGTPNYTG